MIAEQKEIKCFKVIPAIAVALFACKALKTRAL